MFHFLQPRRRTSALTGVCVCLLLLCALVRPAHTCGTLFPGSSEQTGIASASIGPGCMACLIDVSTVAAMVICLFSVPLLAGPKSRSIQVKRRMPQNHSYLFVRPPPAC